MIHNCSAPHEHDRSQGANPHIQLTFEEEAEIDLGAVKQEIASLESQLATARAKMKSH